MAIVHRIALRAVDLHSCGRPQLEPLEERLLLSINHAPVLAADSNLTFINLPEDSYDNGSTVAELLVSAGMDPITDADSGALEGIAVTYTDRTNGDWQFSTTGGGSSWSPMFLANDSQAYLLAPDARVRFLPKPLFSGTAQIDFRAWDQTSGSSGDLADVTLNGDITAFSAETATATITVTPVNHRPAFLGNGPATLATIPEDNVNNAGTRISDIIAGAGGISDPDSGALQGIALVAASNFGTWQCSLDNGATWTDCGTLGYTSARLLAGNDLLRFVPGADFNGYVTKAISFMAWDQTQGIKGGTGDVTEPGSTAYGTILETADISVAPTNDAPILNPAGNGTLPSILEDDSNSAGMLVSDLVNPGGISAITDIDVGAPKGIAVTSVVTAAGTWQFSLDNGKTWAAITAAADSQALLLSTADAVRFVPSANFNGQASFAFRAWDQSSGAPGQTADATSTGGTTAFSVNTATASITVAPANDAPVLDNSGAMTLNTIPINAVNNSGTLISDLIASAGGDRITDIDAGALEGIAIVGTDNASGTWQYTINGGSSWTTFKGYFTSARLLAADANTRIRFVPKTGFGGTLANAITFRAWDQTEGSNGGTLNAMNKGGTTSVSVAVATASIFVGTINHAPVLDTSGTTTLLAIRPDSSANNGTLISALIASAGGDRITDVDAGAVEGIAVVATSSTNGAWQYSLNNGSSWTTFKGYYTGARLLAADANTRIRFLPNAGYAGWLNPAITFRAWDQTSGSNGGTINAMNTGGITSISIATETAGISVNLVNHAPVLDASATMRLNAIHPTDTANNGTLVSDLLASAGGDRIADVDPGAVEGIAVVATDNTNGAWQYTINAGGTWTTFKGYYTGARLLAADANTRIRFFPNSGFSGQIVSAITFRAWDQTDGSNGGTINAMNKGGSTSLSIAQGTASIAVNFVNHPPVLDVTAKMKLNPILVNAVNNSGTLISDLIASAGGNPITDPDPNALEGIAVIASNNCQFSLDGGATWTAFSGFLTQTRLLAANASTRIRYVPAAGFTGTVNPVISFLAWDQTDGFNGGTLDALNGNSSSLSEPFSACQASIVVG